MKNAWGPLAAVSALVIGLYAYMARPGAWESLTQNAADSSYNLLVQGFRAGQLGLKKEVPPGLTQLVDPYDPAANARFRGGTDRLHDLSYYKGKLYLYFGITPAVMLFWPFVALTGHYLFHGQAVVIFCAIGFLTSVGVLGALWRRYFSEVSLWVVAACALALGLATGVPVMLPWSGLCEVAISCGYMLTMLALGAIWCALHEPERRRQWVAAASVAYGLAVGARPSLLFGGIILLVPVIQAWRKRRQTWSVLTAATGPIILIGLGLMLYNALRFDNPFEFGWRYQLAGERQIARQLFSLRYLWFNFRVYFLEPAHWSGRFPFIHDITVPPLPVGHGGVEHPFGVLTNIPLVWLALAVPLAWRGRPADARSALCGFAAAVAVFFGISTLTLSLFFAACTRYEVDFLPALVLLAVIGVLGAERALAPTPTSKSGLADQPAWRRAARCGWGLLLVFSVAFNLFATVPYYAEMHCNLGMALMGSGRIPEAIGHLRQALRLNPNYAEAHNDLGLALYYTGEREEAITHYKQAIRIKPDYAEAHYNWGNALIAAARVSEAIGQYEQALRINPDLAEAQNNLAWVLATLPPAEGGKPARAVQPCAAGVRAYR